MFTDFFATPVAVGDTVAWPTKLASAAHLRTGKLVEIVPLIQHRDYPEALMREDQRAKARPTTFYSRDYPDPSKHYVAKVEVRQRRWRSTQWVEGTSLTTVHNTAYLIRKP